MGAQELVFFGRWGAAGQCGPQRPLGRSLTPHHVGRGEGVAALGLLRLARALHQLRQSLLHLGHVTRELPETRRGKLDLAPSHPSSHGQDGSSTASPSGCDEVSPLPLMQSPLTISRLCHQRNQLETDKFPSQQGRSACCEKTR